MSFILILLVVLLKLMCIFMYMYNTLYFPLLPVGNQKKA